VISMVEDTLDLSRVDLGWVDLSRDGLGWDADRPITTAAPVIARSTLACPTTTCSTTTPFGHRKCGVAHRWVGVSGQTIKRCRVDVVVVDDGQRPRGVRVGGDQVECSRGGARMSYELLADRVVADAGKNLARLGGKLSPTHDRELHAVVARISKHHADRVGQL